jgi:RimJ/RimL family protein N-acetyltransferase
MIECMTNHPSLPGLFDPHVPNNPALWAVFQGRHAGRALVDDPLHPSQCVLRTDACLTYTSEGVKREFLEAAIMLHRHTGQVWLIRQETDVRALEGVQILPRLKFFDYEPNSPILESLRSQIPDSYTLRRIDQALLERCEWRDDMVFYCGSLENFLRNDLGICLMHGEEIIVEAYASALGAPYAEIGAITHEPYRGRGYAPMTVAYLIDLLERGGYHGYWSCDVDNPASARVARKLGFKVEKPYEVWVYEPIRG